MFRPEALTVLSLGITDINEELKTTLVEEYENQRTHTDGEIYRKIRQYEEEQNEPFRQRWLARLSQTNRERLEQLDSPKKLRLRKGFDALLTIPGLWCRGMRISVIHRLVAIDCVEVGCDALNLLSGFSFSCFRLSFIFLPLI